MHVYSNAMGFELVRLAAVCTSVEVVTLSLPTTTHCTHTPAIVVCVPLAEDRVFAVRCVVPGIRAARVIGNCVQLIAAWTSKI